jgi:preprotein translocase subunit SecA
MNENFEIKDSFTDHLETIIEIRKEGISLIRQILEKSESKVQNKKDVEKIIEKIIDEFIFRNKVSDENDIDLLRSTLEIIFEKQLINSRLANKVRNHKIDKGTLDFLLNLE